MNKIINLLFLGWLLSLALFSGLACATDKTYVISYSPDSQAHQLIKDRIKAVYQRAGLKAEFIPLPLNRSLLSANNGTVDGDVGRVSSIAEKYPDLLRIETKLMDFSAAVYTIDPKIDLYDESLLSKYRVGYVRGIYLHEQIMAGRTAVTASNDKALFEMLLQGRIDLVLATVPSADAALHDLGSRAGKVRQLLPFVATTPMYHYVNKKNTDIIPRLEQAIKEINAEGVFVFYTGIQSPLYEILQQRLKEAFQRIGKICELRATGSAQRALLMANEIGDGDAYRNGKMEETNPDTSGNLLLIPESIGEVEFIVYTNGKPVVIAGWEALTGLRNGLRDGVILLEKNIPQPQTRLPDTDRLLKMLAENRLDTVTEHGITADYRIQKLQLQGITKLTPPLTSFPGYSYIHKKHAALIPALSESLAAMKKEGRFLQIEKEVVNSLLTNLPESAL